MIVLIATIGIIQTVAAQDKPVQLAFTAVRTNDSIVTLQVKANIAKGVKLFSVKKQNEEDAFVSSVEFDSVKTARFVRTTDVPVEKGNLQTEKDTSIPAEFHFFTDSVTFEYVLHVPATDTAVIKMAFNGMAKTPDGEFPPVNEEFSKTVLPAAAGSTGGDAAEPAPIADGLGATFLLCLITGLLAVITPCVFPLIPVTVSFFLKKSATRAEGVRNALTYSLSIILIYTIPTLILTMIFGQSVLYTISTSAVSNLLFFTIFLVFAISFFGAFELTLPSSWATKADEKAGKGGFIGVFFMALTLVIVSFSCTGPIVGTLLGQTSKSGIGLKPILGMLGFSLGLALPFSLFALFPSMLKSLPKSGGWLNSVKIVFGFVELALGLKFLSNVDLIYGWHLLDREVFLALWIVLAILLGLYLLGKITFSHDSPMQHVSIPRLFLAIASFSFAVYLTPGMWGAPLKAMSGLLPPSATQDFNLDELQYKIGNGGASAPAAAGTTSAAEPPKKLVNELHVPYGLVAYFDLKEGMAAAKALHKPVMLDFTGHSCANCRKMENDVWKDPEVLKRMKEDFVLISLYVDHPTELPEEEQYTDKDGKKITTVGARNLDYEITKFGFNAQPLYMFLDLEEKPLSDVKYGYDGDKKKFIDHLEKVKEEFKKR
ncbi:thiol:disulfide interchange protein DsbD [Filimonas lacunae]|uniref:Thiol:disulfide interchange protein DsbD n=2 Tax=Filimonas lacunae TaxID=477680 RepID=A0A173MN47_9BACT|nr:cytochrome c-type biogenesis protein DsbD, protein-disulfide reductase [Filimonas lacunae]SIS62267.1 thiol:disulfide interchange protein DsbD [Filimonas lacunae]